ARSDAGSAASYSGRSASTTVAPPSVSFPTMARPIPPRAPTTTQMASERGGRSLCPGPGSTSGPVRCPGPCPVRCPGSGRRRNLGFMAVRLQPAVGLRGAIGLHPVGGAGFRDGGGQVVADGTRGQVQARGDVADGGAVAGGAEDLGFAGGQGIGA